MKFQQLLANKIIDVKQLPTKVVIESVHANMALQVFVQQLIIRSVRFLMKHFRAEYLRSNINKQNEYGYTLFHCLAATWISNNTVYEFKHNAHPEKGRWILTSPLVQSNGPPRQTLKEKSFEEILKNQNRWQAFNEREKEIGEDEAWLEDDSEDCSEEDECTNDGRNKDEEAHNDSDDEDGGNSAVQLDIIRRKLLLIEQQYNESLPKQVKQTEDTTDFDWQELFQLSSPRVDELSNDGETALLLVCKSRVSSQIKLRRIEVLLANNADVNFAVSNLKPVKNQSLISN